MRRLVITASLLSFACGGTGADRSIGPSPLEPTVDVLDYLIGASNLWPRIGSHSQDQVVDLDRQEICWVKYANSRMFECWRWDDSFVYHVVDHAIDGNTGESYRFSDGRWLPRRLTSTWRFDVRGNRITWFDPACRVQARSGVFPYRQRVWIEPRDAGGDLGVRDTLVLDYQPYDPAGSAGAVESFYFGRGAGWYEWDRGGFRDLFNRIGGPARTIAREAVCSS